MVELVTVGLDIAKSVFQVHGVDEAGRVVVRRQLRRAQVLQFFAKLPGCLTGIPGNGRGGWEGDVSAPPAS